MTNIPFTDNYFIDEQCNVYSTSKSNNNPTQKPLILKQQLLKIGYMTIKIRFKNKMQRMKVGYLMLLTFVSDRPDENYQVCHGILGSKIDCLHNVSWKTASQNNKEDKERDGTAMLGEKHPNSKFKNDEVLLIRKMSKDGIKGVDIAKFFNASPKSINHIIHRRTWTHI